jgi:xylulokinase
VQEGQAVVSTGTAEVLSTAFPGAKLGDAMYEGYYPCYLYTRDGMYFTFSLNHVGGMLLRWYRGNFGGSDLREARAGGADFYRLMDSRCPKEPTDLFVLPHFNGSGTPWCDLSSRGAVVGLSLSTTRYDIFRSMLESLTYELKINMEAMEKAGLRFDEIRAVGGGASSSLWLQIKADILGRPILTLQESQAACLGAAILAGAAAGVYSDVDEGVAALVRTKDTYLPQDERSRSYAARYGVYKDIYPALKPVNGRLA